MTLTTLLRRLGYTLGLPVILVALWWVTSASSQNFFWPPLARIMDAFAETWFGPRFAADVLPSLTRLFIGYLVALVAGVGLGVAVGSWRWLRESIEPSLEFFRAIPPPVLVPILILFFGIGETMNVAVIIIGCVWPILLNTTEGVRSVDEVQRDTAACFRFRPVSRLFRLTLPAASPQIAAGARQALSVAIILMVISELFATTNGLGFVIVQFQRSFQIPQMWSGIILLGLIGVALSMIFRFFESRALSWYTGMRHSERGE